MMFVMLSTTRAIFCPMAAGLALAAICCGCARTPDPNRFVPAPELALAAVEAVLADWQAGLALGRIDRLAVTVEPIDNQRKKQQKLAGFEILGEVVSPGVRCFAVRLTYQDSVQEKVRYVVLGINPLYVYRQEDFDLLNHWDHMMSDEPDGKAQKDTVELSDEHNSEGPHQSEEGSDSVPDQTTRPEPSDE